MNTEQKYLIKYMSDAPHSAWRWGAGGFSRVSDRI